MENQNLKRENVFQNEFLTLEKVTFNADKENEHSHVRVVKKDAVAGLLYNIKTKKYIFVKQFRTGANCDLIEIIAGTMDVEGESPEDCLRREVEEETGFIMTDATFLCACYPSPGVSNEKIYIFRATTNGEKSGNGGGVGTENIEIIELNSEEIYEKREELDMDMKTRLAWSEELSFNEYE